ncbi:MAG: hypothetical protein AAB305_04060 [Candidatus Zixiibacteriota bacterium]
MRLLRYGAILAVCLVSTASAQTNTFYDTLRYPQTYSFDFKGDGARAAGMGNAFMAVSDDISAGSWNPAGLYSAELVTFGMSLMNFQPGGSGWGNMNVFSTSDSDRSNFDISDGFTGDVQLVRVIAPLRIKGHPFVFSFGNNRTFEDYQQVKFFSTQDQLFLWQIGPKLYTDTNRIDLSIASSTFTKMNCVNIAFGTRLQGNLSGGISLNVYGGRSFRNERQTAFIDSLRLPTGALTYQFTDFARDVTHNDTTRFSGYNVTIGLKKTFERWAIASVIKTPFTMSAKLDSVTYTISSTVNEYGQQFPQDNGTDTIMVPRSLTKYDIPMSTTLGVSFKPNENTLIAADIEARSWEGKKVKVRIDEELIPGSDSKEKFIEKDPHWQNVFTFRLGGEKTFETGIGKVPVRLGFGSVGIPAPNAALGVIVDTVNLTIEPVVSYSSTRMTTVSFGFGLHWSQIHLDWAFVRSSYKHAMFRDLGSDLSLDRSMIIGFGNVETDNTSNSIMFSFTGVF